MPSPDTVASNHAVRSVSQLATAPGQDMVVFGEDWGRHPSSTQHLMHHLAKSRRIAWVNSIGMRRPRLQLRDVKRIGQKLSKIDAGTPTNGTTSANTPDTLSVINPAVLPWPGSVVANAINRKLLTARILPHLQSRQMQRPLLWTSLPTALPIIGALKEAAVIYYCGDDFSALDGVDHAPVTKMETELARRADVIFAASPQLAKKFPAEKTIHLPHGTDVQLFSKPMPRPADLPERQQGPIAGFYGSLSAWIDIELLAATAELLPQWQFVLIGQSTIDTRALEAVPNITLLGPRPHASLPGYLQHWDASLLPFRQCPQITACNPLKLREYLSSGTPVVATPFPALTPFANLIATASAPQTFATALTSTLSDRYRDHERHASVKQQSWESRANEVDTVLNALQLPCKKITRS